MADNKTKIKYVPRRACKTKTGRRSSRGSIHQGVASKSS